MGTYLTSIVISLALFALGIVTSINHGNAEHVRNGRPPNVGVSGVVFLFIIMIGLGCLGAYFCKRLFVEAATSILASIGFTLVLLAAFGAWCSHRAYRKALMAYGRRLANESALGGDQNQEEQ